MGNNCCGYSLPNKEQVSNPKEVNELQNNIENCINTSNPPNRPTIENPIAYLNSTDDKVILKEKYENFEVNAAEGLESSNLPPSQDNNEKGKTKEFDNNAGFNENISEANNMKLHIDLTQTVNNNNVNIINEIKEKHQKSPKRTTNILNKKEKKQAQPSKNLINLQEIKLSDETNKKLTLLKEKSDKHDGHVSSSKDKIGSPLMRSATINANAKGELINANESEYEQSEKTKKIEEIKKEFIEDKKKLEKRQSDKNIHKKTSSREAAKNANGSISKRNLNGTSKDSPVDENVVNWNHEELKRLGSLSPKKSLLKRAKTIGDELKGEKGMKKKVKFKDLDAKGKKRKK